MPATNTASEMPAIATLMNGRRGWLVDGRLIWAVAGADGTEDDPKEADPAKADDSKDDGDDFDKERALTTIRKLREAEKAGKTTARELEEARAKLKAIEDKDKSETEKLAARATEASEKLTAAEARARDLAIRLSVERAARKLGFIDEDDAYRLIDRDAVEMDDEGDPKNVATLLKDLAKAKPHLIGQENGAGSSTKSVPPTGKASGRSQTEDELVEEHSKRLQATGLFSRL